MEAKVDENYEKYMADVGREHLAKRREQKAIETKGIEARIWEILGACKDVYIEVAELLLLCKEERKAGEDKGFKEVVEWLKTLESPAQTAGGARIFVAMPEDLAFLKERLGK